jgi:hypothetical protein
MFDRVEEFLRANELRKQDPGGYDANLQEAAKHVKLTSFEEWAKQWDGRRTEDINENGVTLWGLITGR